MSKTGQNHLHEIDRLRKVELGDRSEIYIRILAALAAGFMISVYTESFVPLLWSVCYVFALALHLVFIATRSSFVSTGEIFIAASLFANQQISFAWFPVVLFTGEQRELVLVGGILIAIQLLFIVRRSDTLSIYNVVQSMGLICMSGIVYVRFLPALESELALFGSALALVGLNYFFWQNLRIARRIRLDFEAATLAAHQAQKMVAIGRLAGGVAHDFNNNLTAIIGSLEILRLINESKDAEQDIDNALVAAQQAAKTVKQLLLFARMEKPRLNAVNLAELLGELIVLTRRLIPASTKVTILEIESDLAVCADAHQLLGGLVNLVLNGVDAMPNGGRLDLSATRLVLVKREPMLDGSFLPPGSYARILVRDSGHGIPTDIIHRVLEPFFTTKPVGRGTGLGLSMVHGMIKELGGGLAIMSQPGDTSICLFIPIREEILQSGTQTLSVAEDDLF